MKTLLNIIAVLGILAMLAVIGMALTGNFPCGANAGPPVNGFAVVWASVNQPAAPLPDVSINGIANSAVDQSGIAQSTTFIGSGNISHAIGADK